MDTYQNSLSWAAAGELILKKHITILYIRPGGGADLLLIIKNLEVAASNSL